MAHFGSLTFEPETPQVRFGDRFECGGEIRSYTKTGFPDLTNCQFAWRMSTDDTPFESYVTAMANFRKPTSSRISDLSKRWGSAKGFIWMWEPRIIEIQLARPQGPGFEAFMVGATTMSTLTQNVRLLVSLDATWSDFNDTASPSYQAFLERGEPLFLEKAAVFSVHRIDPHEERVGPNWITRYGREWHRPKKQNDSVQS